MKQNHNGIASINNLYRFNVVEIKKLITNITNKWFDDFQYEASTGEYSATKLSEKIRDDLVNIKHKHNRYKLYVQVYLGEKKGQRVNIVAKGIWDPYLDNYATYTLTKENFYCSVIVWGIYHDQIFLFTKYLK